MRRVIRGAAIMCLILPLTACRLRYEDLDKLPGFVENIAGIIGSFQITADSELIGERSGGTDAYTGQYWAECRGDTGKDVVFGGASMEPRQLNVSGYVHTDFGKAVIRIRTNNDVTELEPDEDGYFEIQLNLESGGNYIMVRYEGFTGTVQLTSKTGKGQ